MIRLLRSSYVIARRDFAATVLSKAFIFFLLGPLFPLLLGGVFGSIGARVATQTQQPVIAIAFSHAEFERLAAARERLSAAVPENMVVRLSEVVPEGDVDAQAHRLLGRSDKPVRAVVTGTLADPHLIGALRADDPVTGQLTLMLSEAAQPPAAPPSVAISTTRASTASLAKDRALTAQIGQMLLFFLTILLSGMVLSQLIEEKSNKIIEVIAAAVPIDALFIGKLFAMLAASILGIIVWVSAGALLVNLVKQGGVATLAVPAIGWPAFLALSIVYFAMNYLLLGAVFLTIGAQASTVREVQTLSMPVTFAQVLIFGFATTAIGAPNSTEALIAAVFPLSSPMVMLARAAELPDLWPHLAALAWQMLWVALILHWGARLFRRTVLMSGPRARWWRLRRA
ncbi:MAG TPA: ABC transporter permease [Sphingomicrobium sp.]